MRGRGGVGLAGMGHLCWRRYVLEIASPPSSPSRPFVEVGVDMVTADLLPAALISTNRTRLGPGA